MASTQLDPEALTNAENALDSLIEKYKNLVESLEGALQAVRLARETAEFGLERQEAVEAARGVLTPETLMAIVNGVAAGGRKPKKRPGTTALWEAGKSAEGEADPW